MTAPRYIQKAIDWACMRDWRVFPADPNTKKPYISSWSENAKKDPEEIKVLFAKFPECMMAVPCGPVNKITVIDIDKKNGIDGTKELKKLNLEIPETGVVKTPSGGFHLYYNSGSLKIPNSASKLAPGVDIRGHGGYVIGPESISKFGQYYWHSGVAVPWIKFPPIPNEILTRIMNRTSIRKSSYNSSELSKRILDTISEGTRNTEMASRIGYLLKKTSSDEAWNMAQHINSTRCKPPLHYRELEQTFLSILKRELRS